MRRFDSSIIKNGEEIFWNLRRPCLVCFSFSLHVSLFDREGQLLDVRFRLILDHLVDEGQDVVALDAEKDERRARVGVSGGVRARHAAWVDKVLAIVLRNSLLMGVAGDEDVAVKLTLDGSQSLHVAPRDDLMAMDDTNLKVVDLDNLRLR